MLQRYKLMSGMFGKMCFNMTPEKQEQIFREFLETSRQSGKKETSDLVAEVIKRIDPAIERSVNGGIRLLNAKFDSHKESQEEWKKEDKEWKERAGTQMQLNSDFRLKSTGGLILLSFIGVGNIILFIAYLRSLII